MKFPYFTDNNAQELKVGLGDHRRAQKRDDFIDLLNIGDARGELKGRCSPCVTGSQYCWDRRITNIQYFLA